MGKSAKKRSGSQGATKGQRVLHLADFVRRNLLSFVVSEGMKALDAMLEEDRSRLCGKAYEKGNEDEAKRWVLSDNYIAPSYCLIRKCYSAAWFGNHSSTAPRGCPGRISDLAIWLRHSCTRRCRVRS